jgi:hypothetical protein
VLNPVPARLQGFVSDDIQTNGKQKTMSVNSEYEDLKGRIEALLADLDRLELPFVAAHMDLALQLLIGHIAKVADEATQG